MSRIPVSEKICAMAKVDLNLLPLFCLIYSAGSITKAADLLDISPSAVSQSLRKLRNLLGDNLFVRSGNSLLPTVYADELYDNAVLMIEKFAHLLPHASLVKKKRIILYTESFISTLVIPDLTKQIIESQSGMSLLHQSADLNEQSIIELLNLRQADIIFSTFSVEHGNLFCQKICEMKLVLIAAQTNTCYGDTVNEQQFRDAHLVGYNTRNEKIIYHRSIVDKKFRTGERCLLTTSFTTVLTMVSDTQCLGVIPEKIFHAHAQRYQLKKVETPFLLPQFSIFLSCRKESRKDNALFSLLNGLFHPPGASEGKMA